MKNTDKEQDSSEHENARLNKKSVQEVSKSKANGRHPKTDLRYWEQRVFRPTYGRNGQIQTVGHWAAKIQHAGRRETFSLIKANKAQAAARAKEIYLSLRSAGWDATLAEFKPKAATKVVSTVGDFLEQVAATASGRPKTIESYCRAFRSIVADVRGIDGGKSKFDYRNGGRAQWLARINGVRLASITPEQVQKWKLAFIRRAGSDPVQQRAARISVNSLMRQAKSLFSPGILKFVRLELPSALPFAGVAFEPRQSMQYRSGFDVNALVRSAQGDLPEEQLKILLLATMAGLRRDEIDKLEWRAFDWTHRRIRIEPTGFFYGKSEDSLGDVEVDAALLKVFRGFHARAKTTFVIESAVLPRPEATYTHYRSQRHFDALIDWLRLKGVPGAKPLHTLRKEFGSQMCAKHGIYMASRALRHADIAITSKHYLDKTRRVTVGLGHLLSFRSDNIIPIGSGRARRLKKSSNRRS